MITNDLPLPSAGPRRIFFAQASSLLVAQALTDANERLERHFPTLNSATWGDMLRQLQPDVLVAGKAVTFDWPGLTRRVQGLAAFPELPAFAQPADGPAATAMADQFIAYQQRAVQALAELPGDPQVLGSLAYALLRELAQGNAVAARVYQATQVAGQQLANTPRLPAFEEPVPVPGTDEGTVELLDERRERLGLVPPLLKTLQKNTPEREIRRNVSARRTFRAIVQHHPRSGGKFGFTVRELCTTMRISAASLTEARDNPGRLSLNAVVALSEAMGESPLSVIVDLLAEARGKKRKKRVTQLQRPENSYLK